MSDELFEATDSVRASAPLAERIRPRELSEIAGQQHLLGEGKALRLALESDQLDSFILWGPPGTGKTTLARLIATKTGSSFTTLSATSAGVKEIKEAVERAKTLLQFQGRRTLLFIDEIHRFNKSQQDALLPHVEAGTVTLIGATTENPSFELNAALLSRARVLVLKSLEPADIKAILQRALKDEERGLGLLKADLQEEALDAIANIAGGDARRALNLLDQLVRTSKPGTPLGADAVREIAQKRILLYDKSGEQHYDIISALHKSVRSSDPDAAAYWATRMLEAGEDPLSLCRRLTRMASEDIGNADPAAVRVALSAKEAYDFLGTPEGEVAIIQCAIYLACAPKSDAAYQAYNMAREEIEKTGHLPVPLNIRNAPTKLMKQLDYGKGYQHAHDAEDGVVDQQLLPDGIGTRKFYAPKERGFEKKIVEFLKWIEERKKKKS